jgi:PAS domain S-box-containing protein
MTTPEELRRQAEAQLTKAEDINLARMSPEEIKRLVHELQVYKLELKLQNEELRSREAALEQATQKYHDQYNLPPLGFCELDRTGTILEANLRAGEQLSKNRLTLLNTLLAHYVLPEDQDILYFHLKHLFETGQPQVCELRVKTPVGEPLFMKMESTLHQPDAEKPPHAWTILTDEPRSKRAEEQLLLFSRLFMALADPVILLDLAGTILDINPEAERSYAWRKETLLGQQVHKLLPADSQADFERVFTQCKRGKKIQNVEGQYLTSTGDAVPVLQSFSLLQDSAGDPLAIVITTKDTTQLRQHEAELLQYQKFLHTLTSDQTTQLHDLGVKLVQETAERQDAEVQLVQETAERKEAEEQLATSERQYRFLAENVADGVIIIQAGRIVLANDAITQMIGYGRSELLGRPLTEFFRQDYVEHFQELLDEQVQHGQPLVGTQTPYLAKEGGEIWLEGNQVVIQWEGRPALLLTLRDVTEQKLREIQMGQEQKLFQQLKTTIADQRYRFNNIVGKSAAMQALYDQILKAASTDYNVIVTGESGVGKELVACTIHAYSSRAEKPFVTVNCGSISDSLFEREFFGHRKGSFTGADRNVRGYFEAAGDGVLFLDEVGELTPAMQVTLLRAIENKEYIPVGATTPIKADIRIIAATNNDLETCVEQGAFRADFFYRLSVINVKVPPLRERKEDLPLLVEHILSKNSDKSSPPKLPGRLLDAFYDYDWPGNVRELQNMLQRYLSGQPIDLLKLHHSTEPHALGPAEPIIDQETEDLQAATEQFEKHFLLTMLERYHWHKMNTAKALGIPRRTLYRKLKKYGIS